MQASIENLEGLKRLITVTVPAEDVVKAYGAAFRKAAKNARIDGFRKGHIPTQIIERYYGPNIIGEAYDNLVRETLNKAIEQCGSECAGTPNVSFEKSSFDKAGEFVYTIQFETFPVIEDKPLSEMPLKVVQSRVTDADVDRMIENLRRQQGKWQVVDDAAAEDGRLAKIDFVGRVDGREFDGGKAEDFSLILGRTMMIPGFTEQIAGHKAGDKFTINVTFPEDYFEESLKGKPAEFDITVNSVSEQKLPEVDDAFCELFGVKEGGVETLRRELRANMEREQKRVLFAAQRANVCQALLDYFGKFDVPASLVEEERKRLCDAEFERVKRFNKDAKSRYGEPGAFAEEAANNARLGLLMRHFVEKSGLRAPSEESVNEALSLFADAYENPEMIKAEIRKNSKQLASFRDQAFERDLFNYIQLGAKCEVKEMNFSDLLQIQD